MHPRQCYICTGHALTTKSYHHILYATTLHVEFLWIFRSKSTQDNSYINAKITTVWSVGILHERSNFGEPLFQTRIWIIPQSRKMEGKTQDFPCGLRLGYYPNSSCLGIWKLVQCFSQTPPLWQATIVCIAAGNFIDALWRLLSKYNIARQHYLNKYIQPDTRHVSVCCLLWVVSCLVLLAAF